MVITVARELPPRTHHPRRGVLHSAGLTLKEDPDFPGCHFSHKNKEWRVLSLF